MDGRHKGLLYPKIVLDDLSQRRQTICRAGGVGYYIHIHAIIPVVDAHDKGGRHFIFGRSGNDHFFCPALKMEGGQLLGVKGPGGFYDVLCAALAPWDLPRVALTEYPDPVSVYDQVAAIMLHRPLKGVKH